MEIDVFISFIYIDTAIKPFTELTQFFPGFGNDRDMAIEIYSINYLYTFFREFGG